MAKSKSKAGADSSARHNKAQNTTSKSNQKSASKQQSSTSARHNKETSRGRDPEPRLGVHSYNDDAWYNWNPQLVIDTCNLSLMVRAGEVYDLEKNVGDQVHQVGKLNTPGIMRFTWMPSLGTWNYDDDSAAVIAFRNMYSYIRHANSGHANYDPEDLFNYITAIDSLYSFRAMMLRAYGAAKLYSSMNRYIGDSLLRVMGFNADDLRRNLAQFKWFINDMTTKLQTLYIPNQFAALQRHMWLNSNVFLDAESPRAQLNVFVPKGFAVWQEGTDAETPGRFGWIDWIPNNAELFHEATAAECYDLFNTMWNNIIGSEDLGIINGDILKAYGSGFLIPTTITSDWTWSPVYEPRVMLQMHNATLCGQVAFFEDATMSAEATGIAWGYNPQIMPFASTSHINGGLVKNNFLFKTEDSITHSIVMDFPNTPDPAEVMYATRLCVIGTDRKIGQETYYEPFFSGSDVVCVATVYLLKSNTPPHDFSEGYYRHEYRTTFVDVSNYNATVLKQTVYWNAVLDNFAMAPKITVGYGGAFVSTGDVLNIAQVDGPTLTRIHRTAMLSLYGVPMRAGGMG